MYRFTFLFLLLALGGQAQDIPITKGWRFKTGDQADWASAAFADSGWAPIEVGKSWESQGYERYDGFAWYRLHVFIPSSIKDKSVLKEKLEISLGKIDDGDEVYLNGILIGKNAGKGGKIQEGRYDVPRNYTLSLSNPAIHWDQENIIAVRVWDGDGDGGMYEGDYGISVQDVILAVGLEATGQAFRFPAPGKLAKDIILHSSSSLYDFTGKLRITVTDPLSGQTISSQTYGVDFAKDRPFTCHFAFQLPENKSYTVRYTFREERTGKELSVAEGLPYLLTPATAAKPAIQGPRVYGVRPGSPLLYRIPATGAKPIRYEAGGLPPGLSLDARTGIISGKIAAKGSYELVIRVSNAAGKASRKLTIHCGDQIGLTPVMGWNSWNCWGLSVNDEKVKAAARVMQEKLADHGWSYINIDDGWQDKRDEKGNIMANNKFPDMKSLADYVHSLGLKIGLYSSPGELTCGKFAGSYGHEAQDMATYTHWGFDYLKYDWCSYEKIAPIKPSLEDYQKPYALMHEAILKSPRDVIFSLCQYGMGDVWTWGASVGGNSWRTTGDITDTWSSLSSIGFRQDIPSPYTSSGHFNDPDMLIVGRLGWGPSLHPTRISPDEQYTHISLWCLLSSPLLIGCDISELDPFTLNLLTNDEVIAVDQDAAAKPARKLYNQQGIQVWTKELEDGSQALGIFNLTDSAAKPVIEFSNIHLMPNQALRDLWRQKDLGVFVKSYSAAIPSHGVILLKARPAGSK